MNCHALPRDNPRAIDIDLVTGFLFGDRGEFVPKGFDEGVRLSDVQWAE